MGMSLSDKIAKQEKLISDFTLFPNPTSGSSSIKITASTQPMLFQVRSITGTVIQEITVAANSGAQVIPLNLKGILPGIYMVQMQQEMGILTKRLVVHLNEK